MTNCPYPARLAEGRYHCRHDGDLQHEYGPQMTCEVYWTQFYEQGGACGGCRAPWAGTPGERTPGVWRLSVDHEHAGTTDGKYGAGGPFRGLLCQPCNRLLTEGVIAQVRRRADELEIVLPGGDVVTPSQCAYARNPPAARLGVWITGRRRPQGTAKEQAKARRAAVSPMRAHLRVVIGARGSCERSCPHGGHGGVVRVPTRWPATVVAPRVEPEPAPTVPRWVPVAARVLQVLAATLGIATAALVVWALLPVLAGLAVLAVTGLLAARS